MHRTAGSLEEAGNADPRAFAAIMGTSCREILRRLEPPKSDLAAASGSWNLVSRTLTGLEQMSRQERSRLGEACREAVSAAQSAVAIVPARWYVAARGVLTSATLSPADFADGSTARFEDRVNRQMEGALLNESSSVARQLHKDLLTRLADAADCLAALACTADELRRAMESRAGTGDRQLKREAPGQVQIPLLTEYLAARREGWRSVYASGDAEPSVKPQSEFEVGKLAGILQGSLPPALYGGVSHNAVNDNAINDNAVNDGAVGNSAAPVGPEALAAKAQAFRRRALERARFLLCGFFPDDRETPNNAAGESVSGRLRQGVALYIEESFRSLEGELDKWLSQLESTLSLCLREAFARAELQDAIRTEVSDILRDLEPAGETERIV